MASHSKSIKEDFIAKVQLHDILDYNKSVPGYKDIERKENVAGNSFLLHTLTNTSSKDASSSISESLLD